MTTNCVFPPELDDTQLLAHLDDPDANPETAQHLENCTYCRERAHALDRFQKRLTTRLYRSTCPSPMELGDYHLNYLLAPQKLVIAQHLRECPHCQHELEELERFLSDLVPEYSLLEEAKVLIARLIGPQTGSGQQGKNGFGSVVSALRGDLKGPITLEADGIVIMLDIQPTNDGRLNILGQVAADNQEQWTGALVEIRQDNELQFSSVVDDLGAFRCEGIVPGSKELRIAPKDNSLIVVSNLEV